MASTTDELRILLRTVADTGGATQIRQALRGVQDEAKQGGGALSALGLNTSQGWLRAGLAIGGFSAGLNVAAGLASSLHDQLTRGVQGAIDLAESMNKLDVVFGASAASVKAIGANAATSLGTTQNAALAAAGTFGNLFVSMGLTQKQAGDMSVRMVQLAADLASFNNIRPEDALQKLQSGLVGEIEPLRTLGVAINETQTQAKALALGFQPVNGQLSETAKVQARYALILEQTKTAQGDFARTADSLANQQRIAAASIDETAIAVGQKLTPTLQEATAGTIGFATSLKEVLPGAVEIAVAEARRNLDPFLVGLRDTVSLLARIKGARDQGAAQQQAEAQAAPELRAQAFTEVNLALNQQGQYIDAVTGAVLDQVEALDRLVRAEELVAAGFDKIRASAKSINSADIDFLTGKIGAGPLSGAALDEALRKAAQATAEINAENRGPVLHPVEALRTNLADQLAQLEEQRTQAGRQNTDLALREADARIKLLPVQQELADLQREITAGQQKGLQLTREEAVLRAQQQANPANDALEDVQTRERRLQILAGLRGPERGQARRDLRALTRSGAIPRAELAALDANAPLTNAQRAQRDTALTTQLANIPNLIQQARLEIDAGPLEAALGKIQAQQETEAAARAKVLAGLDRDIQDFGDNVKRLDGILSGKPSVVTEWKGTLTLQSTGVAAIDDENARKIAAALAPQLSGDLANAIQIVVGQGTVPAGTPGGSR